MPTPWEGQCIAAGLAMVFSPIGWPVVEGSVVVASEWLVSSILGAAGGKVGKSCL
ncbi:hypothetical protein GCM10027513_17060 [Giesbergeria giesbergeri]